MVDFGHGRAKIEKRTALLQFLRREIAVGNLRACANLYSEDRLPRHARRSRTSTDAQAIGATRKPQRLRRAKKSALTTAGRHRDTTVAMPLRNPLDQQPGKQAIPGSVAGRTRIRSLVCREEVYPGDFQVRG